MGPQHTFNSPHLPTLTFPYISPYLPTPHHTFLHLLSYLFPHPSFLPPHPNTFSYYPHTSPLTFSKCGEVTMRRSFCGEVTVAKLPCGEVTGNLFNYLVVGLKVPCSVFSYFALGLKVPFSSYAVFNYLVVAIKVPCSSLWCFQLPCS